MAMEPSKYAEGGRFRQLERFRVGRTNKSSYGDILRRDPRHEEMVKTARESGRMRSRSVEIPKKTTQVRVAKVHEREERRMKSALDKLKEDRDEERERAVSADPGMDSQAGLVVMQLTDKVKRAMDAHVTRWVGEHITELRRQSCLVMDLDGRKYLEASYRLADDAVDWICYHPEGLSGRYPGCIDEDTWTRAIAMEDHPDYFDRLFDSFVLDGIVAVRENLAMTSSYWLSGRQDKVTTGIVKIGPGLELGTNDYVECNVAFGHDCKDTYVKTKSRHRGMVKAVWVSWDEKFIPDRQGGEGNIHRRWHCIGNNLPLNYNFSYQKSGRQPPKVVLTMLYFPK